MGSNIHLNTLVEEIQKLVDTTVHNVEGIHEELLEKIELLKYAVQTPWETLWETRFQMLNPICKRVAIEMGVVEAIAGRGGKPVSAQEIANETAQDRQVIERIMRILTNMHMFSEVGTNTYAANDITKLLCTKEGIAAEKYFYDFLFPIGASVVDCMRAHGLQQFPVDEAKTPFEYAFGSRIFDYLQDPRNTEAKQTFDSLMRGRREGAPIQWFDTYPISKQLATDRRSTPAIADSGGQSQVLVVDVAGGHGHDILAFARTMDCEAGQLVLQDLPITLSHIEASQKDQLQKAGVCVTEYNFFTPQPIRGARFYFFRDICHDWHDDEARAFLRQTAQAMTPRYSRLLIEDHIVDAENAHHRPAASDMLMMLVLTGRERTEEQWRNLIDSVGLEIVKIWHSRRGHQSVIETWKAA